MSPGGQAAGSTGARVVPASRRSAGGRVLCGLVAVVALGGCSLMEPKEDPALVKAQQVEGRVAQVERQTQGMLDLQRQIEGLQADVRRLRGELEQAQFEAQSAKTQQRDLYADLDKRLQALEQRAAAPAADAAASGGAGAGGSVGDRDAYQQALDALKTRDYTRAEGTLRDFPQRYPQSALLDNAKYWLGETFYVQRKYEDALQAFQRVLREHPDSGKVPDSLLKAGYSEYELKKYREARDFLNRVVRQFPDAPAAASARERLARMNSEKH
jgi:tol-pal system protein YbgF